MATNMADLARVLLAEELRTLVAKAKSGVLEVDSGEWAKALFLIGGRVVFASSTLDKDKLGEHLIRLGRISRDQFVRAFERSQLEGERLGQVLVDVGLLDEQELGRLVAVQVQKIAVSLFTLTSGQMRFHEGTDPIPRDLALDLSTARILFEGARVFPDIERLERALGSPDRRFRAVTPAPFARAGLSPAEKDILDAARTPLRLADLLARSHSRPLLVRAAYALFAGSLIEEPSRPAARVAERPSETFQLAVPRPSPPVVPSDGEAPEVGLREQVLHLYEALPRATHYEVLQVPPDATLPVIDAAYRRLTAEQDREWRDIMGDVQMSSLLGTLRLRRREAYLVLSDPNRRLAYDKRLGHSAPVDERKPVTAERHTRAKHLTQEAQRLLDHGERERAIPLLLEAVDLDPEERPTRRLLAVTLAHHPTLQRTAERHFLVALEQDPQDLDLRFRLGVYYRRMNLPARAVVHLRAVIAADPEHLGAQRELTALEPLDSR
jgi:hypothetical protein